MKKKTMLVTTLLLAAGGGSAFALTPQQELGKSIFFDENLSFNSNQSCAVCHAPESGWTGPVSVVN